MGRLVLKLTLLLTIFDILPLATGMQCYNCFFFSTDETSEGERCKSANSLPDSFLGESRLHVAIGGNGKSQLETDYQQIIQPGCVEVAVEGEVVEGQVKSMLVRVGLSVPYISLTPTGCNKKSYLKWKQAQDEYSQLVAKLLGKTNFSNDSEVNACFCKYDKCNNKLGLGGSNKLLWVVAGVLVGLATLTIITLFLMRPKLGCVKRLNVREEKNYFPLDDQSEV